MSKYLDLNGLSTLWGKIKTKFVTKDDFSSAMSSKQNVLGINPSTGSTNKFLNQRGSFVAVETDLSAYAKKTDIPTTLPASDVKAWAKADNKPTYTKGEIGLGNVDNTADSAKDVKHAKSADSVAWSGVTGKPTIPTVNNSLITINQGGNKVASFSLNQSTGATINLSAGKVYSNATQTSDGLMSSADKKKLDGMRTGNFLTQEEADKRYMAKEHVVVTLTTTAGSVEGLKVHVQDPDGKEIPVSGDLTWKGKAIEFDISAGVLYKVVGGALVLSGYVLSCPETKALLSTGGTRNVTLAYNPQKLNVGIYIETLDGKAVTADNYSGGLYKDNPNVNSILVVTSSWTGRIALDVFYNIKFSASSPDKKISGTMDSDGEITVEDMDGAGNTDLIIKNIADSIAAKKAFDYTFRSGQHGYLPALGELKTIINNATEVGKCFKKLIGSTVLDKTTSQKFWSSTQFDTYRFWYGYNSYRDFCNSYTSFDQEYTVLIFSL